MSASTRTRPIIKAIDPEEIPLPPAAHCNSQTRIQKIEKETRNGLYALFEWEVWWQDQYDILVERGYKPRRRFRKNWTPSWLGADLIPQYCEDSASQPGRRVLDAIRISDGIRVCIKKVENKGGKDYEYKMLSYFHEPERRNDIHNPSVPVLDYFKSTEERYYLLVMPYLCEFDQPFFVFVDEVLDFMSQTLEGVKYLHERRVAHRDLGYLNIMMDGELLYPDGHHPSFPSLNVSTVGLAKCLRRRDVAKHHPVKYYFIDFEAAMQFKKPSPKVYYLFGQDPELPELSFNKSFSPYPVDIFMLGNVYRKRLVQKYSNLAFLEPLVSAMVRQNPDERPSASEALVTFHTLVKTKSWFARRNRLRGFEGERFDRIILDTTSFVKEDVLFRLSNLKQIFGKR